MGQAYQWWRVGALAAALAAMTAPVQAGGIERNAFTTDILFEQGTYVELGYTFVSPSVSGIAVAGGGQAPGTTSSGDMAPSYGYATLGLHQDLTERLSFSFVIDEPVGADVDYPAGVAYPFQGSTAEIRATQLTAALRYEITPNVSVHGGLRALSADGQAFVNTPAFAYVLEGAESDYEAGYMVGAAFERPDIALRVALTYFSEIELGFTGAEGVAPAGTPEDAIPTGPSAFDVTIPRALLLEAQSGVAENTLVFGSIRWTEWTEFDISPPLYVNGAGAFPGTGSALVDYDDDVWSYTLGVGRRLSENWAVSASVGYEAEQDSVSGNLGPTDGRTSVGLGAEYSQGPLSVAFGVQYSWIGDAETRIAAADPGTTPPTPAVTGDFDDNTAVAAGIRIGYQF